MLYVAGNAISHYRMKFDTTTITGSGKGKMIGFPTLNMIIPDNLPLLLKQGVYAARAVIGEDKYFGVLYYGPSNTSGGDTPTLEIHLLDTAGLYVGPNTNIHIDVQHFIRHVMAFEIPELLIEQLNKDIAAARATLA